VRVRASARPMSYKPVDGIHQTLVDDVIEGTDKLFRF